jgi:cytochrome d ubiquinol oxidase subunit II
MLVLWVLILRGISIELRSHLQDGMWRSFWDAVFALSSTLAPILFGAALGNLIRGVPLNEKGWFALSLFESFSPHDELGLLDWYTVSAGILALVAVLHHGALFLSWKTDGIVRERSRKAAGYLFPIVVLFWAVATAATAALVPGLFAALAARPLAWLAALVFLAGLATAFFARRAGRDLLAFIGSSAFLLGVLASTAASVYPVMIRSAEDESRSLTALNTAASRGSLTAALTWWPVGIVLAVVYYVLLFRIHRGKARPADEGGY